MTLTCQQMSPNRMRSGRFPIRLKGSLRRRDCVCILLLCASLGAHGQSGSYIKIDPTDKEADVVRKAAHVVPSERQLRWQQLELTAFFHFGINTFTDHEWGDGKEDIAQFNPSHLDAGQWIKTMKDAGFRQVIITAKHHDGFCLWPSKYTEHSIKNTAYKGGKGDVVKEVADACRQYGMGFGVYLSPWDRNSPLYGDSLAYNTYFINQLTELLTQYGRVDEVWFDGANGEGPNGKKQVYDFNSWYRLIRKLQPQAVIAVMGPDVRWVGTESGVGRLTEWSVLPVNEQSQRQIAATSQKDMMVIPGLLGADSEEDRAGRARIAKANALVWYPAETDVSIRPGWFYHASEDEKVKTPAQLMETYFTSVGRNGVLLLNVPPNRDGLLSSSDAASLTGFAHLFAATFAHNLIQGAAIERSSVSVAALTDKKLKTVFPTKASDTAVRIVLKLNGPKTFDVLELQENITSGQRVEKFIAEYHDGARWHVFASGTTIGYKRLLKFPPVTAKRVRLHILSSRLNPQIAEIGLYKFAAADAAATVK